MTSHGSLNLKLFSRSFQTFGSIATPNANLHRHPPTHVAVGEQNAAQHQIHVEMQKKITHHCVKFMLKMQTKITQRSKQLDKYCPTPTHLTLKSRSTALRVVLEPTGKKPNEIHDPNADKKVKEARQHLQPPAEKRHFRPDILQQDVAVQH